MVTFAFALALSIPLGVVSAGFEIEPTVRSDGLDGPTSRIWTPLVGEDYGWTKPFPSARSRHAMAYDSESDRVVLFGGSLYISPPYSGDTWSYDINANTWTNLNPSEMPSARSGHAMAYDSESDRVIMFGSGETWSYDLNANGWTEMNPTVSPGARDVHAMAYDSQSDRIILFGGVGAGRVRLNDTWAYDFEANTWTDLAPPIYPSAREGHAMAYDSQSDRVVLFGGLPSEGTGSERAGSKETWAYDIDSNAWVKLTPAVAPSGRFDHAMVYDSQSDRVVLFGGHDMFMATGSTWAFDLDSETWTRVGGSVSPLFRYSHAMAYDLESDRVILFAGAPGHWSYNRPKDTWAYDFETDEWALQLDSPPLLREHAMAYDSESDRVILFGGCCSSAWSNRDYTYAYDVESTLWQNLNPSVRPSWRRGHAMAYDSESDRVVLFGGCCSGLSDTWAYDFNTNTWRNMAPEAGPSIREGHAMAYDSESDRVVLFGGSALGSDETWAYDLNTNTWTNMAPVIRPSGRVRHAMAYDEGSDRIVLFGGSGDPDDDTWAYDLNTNLWVPHLPLNAPSGRSGHAMAYDPWSDRVILFGGESVAGFNDETWSYDSDRSTWTELTPSTRPSARSRHAMAYDSGSDRFVLFGGRGGDFAHNDETWLFDPPIAGDLLIPVGHVVTLPGP